MESPQGWHILQVIGHEVRTLDSNDFEQLRQLEFTNWLESVREQAEIEIFDRWQGVVPAEPTLPPELSESLQQPIQR
jgi:hypothetical protein